MNTSLPEFVQPLGSGIWCIDTAFHRDRFDAAYLMVDDGQAAFIDTGTNYAVPRHLAALEALGLPRSAVRWVIPTHVHLDHAGGAGSLMQALPEATMLVHPRGQRHMVDPSVLEASALSIYGPEAMARDYGTLVPVDAARVQTTHDGMSVALGRRRLEFADTPGHALHHHCVWDEASRGWFTGDTFGLSYREFDTARGPWISASSTPVQFDPPRLRESVARLLARTPQWMYLTHFGRIGEPARMGAELSDQLHEMEAFGLESRNLPDRDARLRERLLAMYLRRLRAHGCTMDDDAIASLLQLDLDLNAQGLGIWVGRQPG